MKGLKVLELDSADFLWDHFFFFSPVERTLQAYKDPAACLSNPSFVQKTTEPRGISIGPPEMIALGTLDGLLGSGDTHKQKWFRKIQTTEPIV